VVLVQTLGAILMRWLLILSAILLFAGTAYAGDPDSIIIRGQDAAGCYDTKVRENSPYYNYGYGDYDPLALNVTAGIRQRAIVWFTNIDTIGAGRKIDSVVWLGRHEDTLDVTVTAYQFLKTTIIEDTAGNTIADEGVSWNWWDYLEGYWGMAGADSGVATGTENTGGQITVSSEYAPSSAAGWTNSSSALACEDELEATNTATATLVGTVAYPTLAAGTIIDSVTIKTTARTSSAAVDAFVGLKAKTVDGGIAHELDLTTGVQSFTVTDVPTGWGFTSAQIVSAINADSLFLQVQKETGTATCYVDCFSVLWYYHILDADYDSTSLGTVVCTDTGFARLNIGSTLPQAAYDGTVDGIYLLLTGNSALTTFSSSENATEGKRPAWIIYHQDTVTAVPVAGRRRRILMEGE
jgi:hypothetical protein